VYAKARPSYPLEAIRAALEGLAPVDGRTVRAADVGCGTGISTRLLAEAGAIVVGIDPNPDMLETARRGGDPSGRITWRRAPAEATGLDADSFDLVVAAQAFHWFWPDEALTEFHRILRVGARAAHLWNVRDRADEFTAEYGRIVTADTPPVDVSRRAEEGDLDAPLRASPLFHDARTLAYANSQTADEEGLLQRAASASYFPREEPARGRRMEELRELFSRHALDGQVTLRYRTELTIATVTKAARR
jgi:SAM-dependent methyltransferase